MSSRLEEAGSANGNNGNGEPDAERHRVAEEDLDGPMEDEETAKQKLEEAGFRPGNFTEEELTSCVWYMTPLIHFCFTGDLRMCRFLLTKGASTTESCEDGSWFPLMANASEGHIDVLEWLCENGAERDIKRVDNSDLGPLCYLFRRNKDIEDKRKWAIEWLILHGALEESRGEISDELVKRDVDSYDVVTCEWLLSWAEEAVNTHSCFQEFLMGTILPEFSVTRLRQLLASQLNSVHVASMITRDISREQLELYWQELASSSNSVLNGKTGVLEHIANFVGVVRGRKLRLKRQLAEKLKPIMINGGNDFK